MGVLGLWQLIESSGTPVPFETLENKVICIDISIWLHQVVKGYTDGKGGHIHNAHLIGLINRICKLLYFRIKPVFIFDGRACALKWDTIEKRAQQKSKLKSESDKIEQLLLQSLAKERVIKEALGIKTASLSPLKKKQPETSEKDDMFKLPENSKIDYEKLSVKLENEEEFTTSKKSYHLNINNIDVESAYFKSLAPDIRHDILIDIKETRKQNTWAKLKDLPVESNNFSEYQMSGLLKRRKVQMSLEEAEKEMGGKVFSLQELESLLVEDGILNVGEKNARRIAGDENTRVLLVKNIAKAIEEAKLKELNEPQAGTSKDSDIKDENLDDYDLELQKAIQMSLGNEESANLDINEPRKLNAQQRKKFVSSIQSHGLVKGFMKEYGEMNDADIKDMIDATQIENEPENDSLTQQFPHTDRYVLYGTPEKSKSVESESPENKEMVITIDSANYSHNDDIFADIFEDENKDLDVEIASISDDDTIEYEISEKDLDNLNKELKEREENSESLKKLIIDAECHEKTVDSDDDVVISENDKFWIQLDESEDLPDKVKENKESEASFDKESEKESENSTKESNTEKEPENNLDLQNIEKELESNELTALTREKSPEASSVHQILDKRDKIDIEIPEKAQNQVSEEPADKTKESKTEKRSENDEFLSRLMEIEEKAAKAFINEKTPEKNQEKANVQPQAINNELSSKNSVPNSLFEAENLEIFNEKPNPSETTPVKAQSVQKPNDQVKVNAFDILKSPQKPKSVEKVKKVKETDDTSPKKKMTEQEEVLEEAGTTASKLSYSELLKMEEDIKKQQKGFEFEKNKLDRFGTSITASMNRECKELLRLFGIPYIDSPTEAEAQCAFFNSVQLADGIITDDSDVWLFGAKTVYKNFFLQKKVVKKFEMTDIENKFKLDRKKLIQLAMLVGSDYTLGIHGVGAVTALEILASFPSTPEEDKATDIYQSLLSSLRKFRDWFENGRQETKSNKGLKSKLKNIEMIAGFPSLTVMKAYLEPSINDSLEPFSWGVPDEESIHEFAKFKLGWSRLKTKEILDPVLKRLTERKQKKMEDYFSIQLKKKAIDNQMLSKRVQAAIGKMSGNADETPPKKEKATRKRKSSKKTSSKEKKEIKEIQDLVLMLSDDDEPPEKMQTPEKEGTSQVKSPVKAESVQKLQDEGKVNAFDVLKSPQKPKTTNTAKTKKMKRKPKENEAKAGTSDESLPWKKVTRIPETKQIIPQKEKDKKEQEANKQKAIEIFKKKNK